MSINLSDPSLSAVREALFSPSDPTTWFLVQYNTPSNPTHLITHSSGSDPVIPNVKQQLDNVDIDVLFGCAELQGRGLIVVYITDRVGGVRRARAIVHSRAFANLFPDYSASITIAHPSLLTEDLVRARLVLDRGHPGQGVASGSGQSGRQYDQGRRVTSGQGSHIGDQGGRTDFPEQRRQVSLPPGAGSLNHSSHPPPPNHSPPDPAMFASVPVFSGALSGTAGAQMAQPTPPATSMPVKSNPSSRSARSSSSVIEPDRPLEPRGISSADYFKDDRPRKVSLTSRIEKALPSFRSSPSRTSSMTPPLPSSPEMAQTPASPGSSRFKPSSISKAWKRRSSQATSSSTVSAPNSPRVDEFGGNHRLSAPPVPPKDGGSMSRRMANSSSGEGSGRRSDPPINYQTPDSSDHSSLAPATNGHPQRISPSPSAQAALSDVSQRTAAQENAIQERFRRDQEARHRPRNREAMLMDDHEEDVRLAYDEPEGNAEGWTETNAEGMRADGRGVISTSTLVATPAVDRARTSPHDIVGHPQVHSEDDHEQVTPVVRTFAERAEEAEHREVDQAQAERLERERLEGERIQAESLAAAERVRRQVEEREQREHEERERNRLDCERRLAEREEAESVERERVIAAGRAERERVEAESIERERFEADRAERERQEAVRLEAERREQESIAEEERKRRVEEERLRLQAERADAIRRKKQETRSNFARGKAGGGMMLHGWLTVQTTKSTMWRRRWFNLYPGEMRLFKSEADIKPIQVIYLGTGSGISHTYEESQVQDSFKVTSQGPNGVEEFFLFTDSIEDKENILEGLAMAKA